MTSATLDTVSTARVRTQAYLLREGYRGYDPYDALNSPLFRLPGLRSGRIPRLGAQQLLKRLPVNVRPLLGIRKGLNPVTLGLAVLAYARLAPARLSVEQARALAEPCVAELELLRSPGYSGACWGYDFDWEARRTRFPAYTPTVVATGIVTNGLFELWRRVGDKRALALCESASRFVVRDLARTAGSGDTFCWSYSPGDRETVLNATLKGARLCAQVASVTGESELLGDASRTVRYVLEHQRPDGSWPYAVADSRTWADNFHTGYVLECLAAYTELTGDPAAGAAAQAGWRRYRSSFFVDGRIPKYFDDRLYPIDATACAQSILTLCAFGDLDAAAEVARWTIGELQRPDGAFIHQLRRRYRNRNVYARWSVAWMLAALARLEAELAEREGR